MPGRLASTLLAAAAALLIAGCGSGDTPVPESQSEALVAQLEDIEQAVDDGNCNIAAGQAASFSRQVQALSDVDGDVKDKLQQAASRLVELANDPGQCVESGATGLGGVQPETEPETSPEETAPTETGTETTPPESSGDGSEQASGETGNGASSQGSAGGGGNLDVGESAGGSSGSVSPDTGGISGGGR